MALLTLITRLSDGFPLVRLTWRAAGAQRTARLEHAVPNEPSFFQLGGFFFARVCVRVADAHHAPLSHAQVQTSDPIPGAKTGETQEFYAQVSESCDFLSSLSAVRVPSRAHPRTFSPCRPSSPQARSITKRLDVRSHARMAVDAGSHIFR
jgi:hypothetical protein